MPEAWLHGVIGFGAGAVGAGVVLYGMAGRYLARGLKRVHDQVDAELREKEAELRRTHDQLLEAIEAMTEGFALFDAEDRLVMCNSVYRDMYKTHAHAIKVGATMEEILRAGLKAEAFPRAKGKEEDWLAARLDQHFQQTEPVEQRLKDGRCLIIQERRTGDGGIVGVRTDVTDLKIKERQMIQSTKLATLGEMAAGMTHELSQPLNIIRFAAEGALMKIDRDKATPEYQREQFARIEEQARRMAEIMEHMRVFSRQDTSDDPIAFDPNVSVASAIHLAESQFKNVQIALNATFEDHGIRVKGRPVQLEQVLLNLINNARDAIVDAQVAKGGKGVGGRIDVATASLRNGRSVRITVQDNGGGIPDDARERIFEPFFTTKDVGRGTGLGLSVSYGIIESMNGSMTVENVDGGARFTVVLPADGAKPADVVAFVDPEDDDEAVARPVSQTECHVLMVDDETDAVDLMADFMEEEGCRVSKAYNGQDALNLAKQDRPDLLVTDLRMPRMNGTELIAAMRSQWADLPVIVVTGHVGETEKPFQEDDNLIVLKKPISLFALEEAVARMRPKTPA